MDEDLPPLNRSPHGRAAAPRADERRVEPSLSRGPAASREPRLVAPRAPLGEPTDREERVEPRLSRQSPAPGETQCASPAALRLVAERDPLSSPSGAGPSRTRKGTTLRRPTLWVAAGALAAIAGFFLIHPRAPIPPAAPTRVVGLPAQPLTPPPEAPPVLIAPPRAATILPPIPTRPEAENAKAEARAAPAAAAAVIAPSPAPAPAAPTPISVPPAPTPKKPTPKKTASPENAPAKSASPMSAPAATAPGIATGAAPQEAKDTNDVDVVTIGGTTYVEGREPRTLGNLAQPAQITSTPPADEGPTNQTNQKPGNAPPPPATDFSITPTGIMTPSGVVTPFRDR